MKNLERNVIQKDWRKHEVKFALVYPNIYEVGISNLGVQLLYFLLNSNPRMLCERFYISKERNSIPRSIESSRELKDFDIIGFSLQYENDYHNVISILNASNIPIRSSNRKENFPIVMAGGPVCTNPIPLNQFFDLFIIGDFEPLHEIFFETYLDSHSRADFLKNISEIPGIHVPSLNQEEINKSTALDLNASNYPITQIIPLSQKNDINSVFQETMLVEVSRGCPRTCNFCMIGCQGLPFRTRSLQNLKNIILKGVEVNQVKKISLIGAGISDHPELLNICQFLVDNQLNFSLPSLRVDKISEDLLDLYKQSGSKTLTMAVEAASQRLRERINKKIEDDMIISTISLLKKHEISNLKLYFMIGLPTETEDDVQKISELFLKINSMGISTRNLKLSINPFIPKPHTPFQWHQMPDNTYFKSMFKKLNKSIPISQIENIEAKHSFIQGCLSLGDDKFGEVLVLTLEHGNNLGNWRRIFKELGMNFKVPHYDIDDILPWDFIHVGYDKNLLKKRWIELKNLE